VAPEEGIRGRGCGGGWVSGRSVGPHGGRERGGPRPATAGGGGPAPIRERRARAGARRGAGSAAAKIGRESP
jgi:hypothetical protein